jgi:hypothetical protein
VRNAGYENAGHLGALAGFLGSGCVVTGADENSATTPASGEACGPQFTLRLDVKTIRRIWDLILEKFTHELAYTLRK